MATGNFIGAKTADKDGPLTSSSILCILWRAPNQAQERTVGMNMGIDIRY